MSESLLPAEATGATTTAAPVETMPIFGPDLPTDTSGAVVPAVRPPFDAAPHLTEVPGAHVHPIAGAVDDLMGNPADAGASFGTRSLPEQPRVKVKRTGDIW